MERKPEPPPVAFPLGKPKEGVTIHGKVTLAMETRMVKKPGTHYQLMVLTERKNHVKLYFPTGSTSKINVYAREPGSLKWVTCDVDDPKLLAGLTVEFVGTVTRMAANAYHATNVKAMKII